VIDRFIGELSYGGGAVNQVNVHLFIESMPFGGTGQSGMGHYYGKHGFDALTHAEIDADITASLGDRAARSVYRWMGVRMLQINCSGIDANEEIPDRCSGRLPKRGT
jgi:hypothetical protein